MPYFYLYDSYLQDRAYAPQLIKLEGTLTDLGLQGKVGRLTLLKSVKDLVESAMREGSTTVVAVGNDTTVSRLAEVLAGKRNVTMGFIPLGTERQNLATILGIPVGILACHVLSSRVIQELNLGKVNGSYFIQSVTLQGKPTLECESHYRLTVASPHNIKICNLDKFNGHGVSNPQNNLLEAVLKPLAAKHWWGWGQKLGDMSIVPAKTIRLSSAGEELAIMVDGYRTVKTPVSVSVATERLRFIVGKKRLF